MERKKWNIGICSIIFTILYIWSNSIQSATQSNEQSNKVLEVIEKVFHTPPLHSQDIQYIVRKAAHVIEFALFGFEMALLLFTTGKMCSQNLIIILFIGLASAVIDETIQVYSQRGSQVMDVWIDLVGILAGMLIALLFHVFWYGIRTYAHRKKQMMIVNQKSIHPLL